jgi:agmatinase
MEPDWPSRPWSFGALPPCPPEQAGVVVLSAPFEGMVSYRPGTRLGPQAIIDASRNMELFEEETGTEPHLAGIATLDEIELPSDPEAALAVLEPVCSGVLAAGKLLVTLGGEHTVSLAPIRAAREVGGELSILQLDAHADLRDSYLGSRYSHACTMRRALEVAPVVGVGIRSFCAEEASFMRAEGLAPFFARQMHERDLAGEIIARLLPRVYVTIDLDVLDPGVMPAVGTPEPGGLGWYDLLALLRQVAARREVVGFDVVELCPLPGNPASDFLAARLIYKLLAYCLQRRRLTT